MAGWYPKDYCAHYGYQWCTDPYDGPPHYPDIPIIRILDVFALRLKPVRADFWRTCRARAISEWVKTGLSFTVTEGSVGYGPGQITLDCVDIPNVTLGGWAAFGLAPITEEPLPGTGWVQVERPEFDRLFILRAFGDLKRIIGHEMGHTLGFAHGGNGLMAVPGTNRVNDEEIAATKEYWL